MNSGTVQQTNTHVVAVYECGDCGATHSMGARRDVLPDGTDCRFRNDLHGFVCTGIMVLLVAIAADLDGSRMTP